MTNPPPNQAYGPNISRLADLMAHSSRYSCHGVGRLAADAHVSSSAISRVIAGKRYPTYNMVMRIVSALEREFGIAIDPRDVVAENGAFPTPFVCDLVGCRGCMPEAATDEFHHVKHKYLDVRPGEWVTSRYPHGYEPNKEASHAD
jgi:hypothetical protein